MEELSAGINTYSLEIFNRWGEMVFTTNNINSRGWDGKFGGKLQPMGVYVYKIAVSYKAGGTNFYNGNVTLIR